MGEYGAQLEELLAEVEGGRDILDSMERERTYERATETEQARRRLRDENELLLLEREGVVKRPTGKLPGNFWELPRPDDPENSVRKALEEDRR